MKKEYWVYISIFLVSIVFLLVSLMLAIHKGKSPKWTARKMKIGGILLSLNAIIGVQSCNREPEVMCYDTVATDQMWLEPMDAGVSTIKKSDTINGVINYPESKNFSYKILDSEQNIIKKAIINPILDSSSALFNFEINFPPNTKDGKYTIMLFSTEIEKQDSLRYLENKYEIIIKNE